MLSFEYDSEELCIYLFIAPDLLGRKKYFSFFSNLPIDLQRPLENNQQNRVIILRIPDEWEFSMCFDLIPGETLQTRNGESGREAPTREVMIGFDLGLAESVRSEKLKALIAGRRKHEYIYDRSDNTVFCEESADEVHLTKGNSQHQNCLDDLVVHVHLGVRSDHLCDSVVHQSCLFGVAQESLSQIVIVP